MAAPGGRVRRLRGTPAQAWYSPRAEYDPMQSRGVDSLLSSRCRFSCPRSDAFPRGGGPFAILVGVTAHVPDELRPVDLSDDDLGWADDELEDDTARLLEERPPHWSA